MIIKPAIAALIASGLITAEKPKLLFPTPAIVKSENIEFSKHMFLLGMPLTFGMFKRTEPYYINSSNWNTTASATNETLSYSHTTTNDTKCIVAVQCWRDSSGLVNGAAPTFNGTAFTLARRSTNGTILTEMWYLLNPIIGTYTLTTTYPGTLDLFGSLMASNLGAVTALAGTNVTGVNNVSISSRSVSITTTAPTVGVCAWFAIPNNTTVFPTLGISAPTGSASTGQISQRVGNSEGQKTEMFYTPGEQAGTITYTGTCTSRSYQRATWMAAAFS